MESWESMTGVAAHMGVKYEGNDTDRHIIDSLQYAKSLEGSSKLYRIVAHYCIFGEVLKPRQSSELRCFSAPAAKGSFASELVILTALASQYPVFSDVYKSSLDWLISKIMGFLKDRMTGHNDVKELTETISKQAQASSELSMVLANGLVRANDNLSTLHERLLETLPALVEAAQPHLRTALVPVGKSCSQMVQFPELESPIVVTEADAMAIRSDEDLIVGKPDNYQVSRIHSLNLDSGACRLEVEGVLGIVSGKIDDITLKQPNNPYSAALNTHSSLRVRARPVYRNDELHRLFITESE